MRLEHSTSATITCQPTFLCPCLSRFPPYFLHAQGAIKQGSAYVQDIVNKFNKKDEL